MAHPAFLDQTEIPAIDRTRSRAWRDRTRPTRIAPTEWGIIIGGGDWGTAPTTTSRRAAVFNALTLNTFLRHGDWVTLANVTALFHGGDIAKDRGVPYVMPAVLHRPALRPGRAAHSARDGHDGPGRDVPARGGLPAATDVPDVDTFSALTADRKRLVLFAVNRTLSDARPVTISMAGFPSARVSATVLTAADPQAGNAWDHPDNVGPQPFPLPPGRPRAGWTATLPPHSLVVFTFTPKSILKRGRPPAPIMGSRKDPAENAQVWSPFIGGQGARSRHGRRPKIQVIDSHTGGEPTRVVIARRAGPGRRHRRRAAARPAASATTASAPPSSTSRAARTCWSARCCRAADPPARRA